MAGFLRQTNGKGAAAKRHGPYNCYHVFLVPQLQFRIGRPDGFTQFLLTDKFIDREASCTGLCENKETSTQDERIEIANFRMHSQDRGHHHHS